MMSMKYIRIILMGLIVPVLMSAQRKVRLDLNRTIEMAAKNSLSAFRYQNLYLTGYWEYRTYRANRLPSLTLDITPARYYRYITQ